VRDHEVATHQPGKRRLLMGLILLIVLVLLLLGAVPAWPHSRNWGYGPSGLLGVLLVVLLVLMLMNVIVPPLGHVPPP
jgi:hypothetical protein